MSQRIVLYKCDFCDFTCSDKQAVEDHELECIGRVEKPKVKKEIPEWKTDFTTYLKIVDDAAEKLKKDKQAYEKFNKYFSGYSYLLSLEKALEWWGTQQGWEYCLKKRKGNKLDMVAALKSSMERNKIWNKDGGKALFFEEEKKELKEGDLSNDGKMIYISGSWCQL